MARTSCEGLDVVITGGARGIGLATAKVLRAAGARVTIADIDGDLAKKEAAELGGGALGLPVDITDERSFTDVIDTVEDLNGSVDVLVNNAGIMPIGPFLDEPVDVVRRMLDINVTGTMTGMKIVLPRMIERGQGHIVNMASAAGKSPVPGGISYAAAKAAVVSMTESARVEFAGTGVRFTCVMPSFTNTDLIAGTHGTRLIRTAEPEEVGEGIKHAIEHGDKDVFVPRSLGPLIRSQGLLGRAVRDRVNHVLGADSAFLEVDDDVRAAYKRRIGG